MATAVYDAFLVGAKTWPIALVLSFLLIAVCQSDSGVGPGSTDQPEPTGPRQNAEARPSAETTPAPPSSSPTAAVQPTRLPTATFPTTPIATPSPTPSPNPQSQPDAGTHSHAGAYCDPYTNLRTDTSSRDGACPRTRQHIHRSAFRNPRARRP